MQLDLFSAINTISQQRQSLSEIVSSGGKRATGSEDDEFEVKLLVRLNRVGSEQPRHFCDKLGEEVATGCRQFNDEYQRELMLTATRDALFKYRFPFSTPRYMPQYQNFD